MHSTCRVFYGSGKFCSAVCRLTEARLIDISKIINYDLMLILRFNYICRQYAVFGYYNVCNCRFQEKSIVV